MAKTATKNTANRAVRRLKGYVDFTSPENDRGLPIEVTVKGNTAVSQVSIPGHMSGWQGPDQTFASKGAIATVLDTVMSFGGIHFLKKATVTKSLTVEYFTMVPVNTKLRAEARLVQQRGDGEAIIECTLSDSKGTQLARSTGTYAAYSVDELRNVSKSQTRQLLVGPGERLAATRLVACKPADLRAFEEMLSSL